jgi:hypothetical protein
MNPTHRTCDTLVAEGQACSGWSTKCAEVAALQALLRQPAQAVPAVEACWHWYSDEEGEWRLKGPPLGGLTEGAEVRLYDQATVDRLRELTERAEQEALAAKHNATVAKAACLALGERVERAEAERDALKAQPAAQAVPLTHIQIIELWGNRSDGPDNGELIGFARAIERAHGIGAAAPKEKA